MFFLLRTNPNIPIKNKNIENVINLIKFNLIYLSYRYKLYIITYSYYIINIIFLFIIYNIVYGNILNTSTPFYKRV